MAWSSAKSKYGNKKTVVDGITFDSVHEAERYTELKMLERAGKISDLELQREFMLIPVQREQTDDVYTKGPNKGRRKPGRVIERKCSYIADFTYRSGNDFVVEDAKGMRTKEYVIKRKLMLMLYGIRIREV